MNNQPASNRRMTALLFNALVFPGCGYFFIGQRRKGWMIILLTVVAVIAALLSYTSAFQHALFAMPAREAIILKATTAIDLAWQQAKSTVYPLVGAIIVLWVYGIVDVLRKK